MLGAALHAHLSIAVLGGAGAPAAAVPGEPAAVYGPLLDRAEAGHGLVLLAGGPAWPAEPWTRFCLQQADRILAVTRGGPVPSTLANRPELQGCDLVAYDAAPGDLDSWAAALHPAGSHLIRGTEFSADQHDYFAWSAAFISYVMRTAGAGDGFPYARSHYVYINAAARQAVGREQGWVITARRPGAVPGTVSVGPSCA